MTNLDMEILLHQLKAQLGVDNKTSSPASTGTKLSVMLATEEPSNKNIPPRSAPPNRKTLKEIKEFSIKQQKSKGEEKYRRAQLEELLRDVSLGRLKKLACLKYFHKKAFLLDSETMNSVIELLTHEKNEKTESDDESDVSPKLFTDFNISNFNVSFNAGKNTNTVKTKSAEEIRKIHTIPPDKKDDIEVETPGRKSNSSYIVPKTESKVNFKPEERVNEELCSPTPRSSSLYQPESDEESGGAEEEDGLDTNSDSSSTSTSSASEVEEDIEE